jgi:hypothetical protein
MTGIRQQQIDDFVQVFYREDVYLADSLGLGLTAEEIHEIREKIIGLWVLEKLADPFMKRWEEVLAELSPFADGCPTSDK